MRARAAIPAIALVTLTSLPATAATRSYFLTPRDLGAAFNDVVPFPDAALTSLEMTFNLPADFKKDSPAKVIAKWHTTVASCTVMLRLKSTAASAARLRLGKTSVVGTPATIGISNSTPAAVPMPELMMKATTYTLTGLAGGTIPGQRKGDLVAFSLERVGGDAADVCPGAINLVGVEFRYQTP